VTDTNGNVSSEMGHSPFGESWYNATNDKLYFTTYEYDAESGNHYAMARYHISRLGRLSSPDPVAGSIADPQSFNRYSYSINDPANITDPSGAIANPCDLAQGQPKNQSQQASGGGPSDSSADDADPPQQGGCTMSLSQWLNQGFDPFGSDWGGGDLSDMWMMGDDSGELPNGGFQFGGGDVASQVALITLPVYTLVPIYGEVGFVYLPGGPGTDCSTPGALCVDTNVTAEYGIIGYTDVPDGTDDLLGFQAPAQSNASSPGPGSPQSPQTPLRPPTQKEYNACMQSAASTRNSAILNARGEQAVGGLLTLIGVGTAPYVFPALGEAFFNEGAAGLVDFAHAGGFAYFGALGPFGVGVGTFGKGTYDVANAWNQYYANTISCAAAVPSHP
jgi:RHS repeat-associated protein